MKAIVNKKQTFGTLGGVWTKNEDIMSVINAQLKNGSAKLLVDTEETLMYELKEVNNKQNLKKAMKTSIDNSQKVFQLVGDMGRQVFCNLSDIPKALKSFDDRDAVEFYFFFNNRPKKISRRKLNDWFKANEINAKFNF